MSESDDEYRPVSDREIQKQVDAWGIDRWRNPPHVHPIIKFCSDAFMVIFCAFALLSFLGGIGYAIMLFIKEHL